MRRSLRTLLLVLPVAAGGLCGPLAGPAAAQVKAKKCRDCHPDIYAEWKESQHAKAWRDPRFQSALKVAEKPDSCTPCHAPNPILDAGIGKYPTLRRRYKSEGVTCVTCHQQGDAYGGPYKASEMDDVGHYSAEVKAFKDYTLCATCHGQEKEKVHNQVRDFLKSEAHTKKKKSCQDCHMPRIVRAPAVDSLKKVTYKKRPGRKHTFEGGHTPAMLAKAATLKLTLKGRTATALVTNAKAAHAIPAAADRAVRLEFVVTPTGGKPVSSVTVWRWKDRLLEHKSRSGDVKLPAGAGSVTATLWACYGADDPRADWAKMVSATASYK